MSLVDLVSDNLRFLVIGGIGYYLAVQQGYVTAPDLPDSTGLVVLALLALGVAGYVAAGRIEALQDEDEHDFDNVLVCMEGNSVVGGEFWNLPDEVFDDLSVVSTPDHPAPGTLMPWQTSSVDVWECYTYEPSTNTAVAGWVQSPTATQYRGGESVSRALDFIGEVRTEYEMSHAKYQSLTNQLRGVVRKLDRRRARDQNAMLDPMLTPSFEDGEGTTVSEVLDEMIEDDHLPDDDSDDQPADSGEFVRMDILDEETPEVLTNGE
jgi:hypothetical protein